jgi:hypothetical protein
MPHTINGCGTRFYGRREKSPDGSFVTTEWIVVLTIPIFPLRSVRIVHLGSKSFLAPFGTTQQIVCQPVPLNWRQVLNVYLTLLLAVALFASPIAIVVFIMWVSGVKMGPIR